MVLMAKLFFHKIPVPKNLERINTVLKTYLDTRGEPHAHLYNLSRKPGINPEIENMVLHLKNFENREIRNKVRGIGKEPRKSKVNLRYTTKRLEIENYLKKWLYKKKRNPPSSKKRA